MNSVNVPGKFYRGFFYSVNLFYHFKIQVTPHLKCLNTYNNIWLADYGLRKMTKLKLYDESFEIDVGTTCPFTIIHEVLNVLKLRLSINIILLNLCFKVSVYTKIKG